jgi:hypothetical protein
MGKLYTWFVFCFVVAAFANECHGQRIARASIGLTDGTYINNAPTGRSWVDWPVESVKNPDGTYSPVLLVYDYEDWIDAKEIVIDDSDTRRISYYGSWRISDTTAIPEQTGNCYCSWSTRANDSLVFRFTKATKFEWAGERMSHHGIAEVFFNGTSQGLIDTYQANNERLTINWSIGSLDTAEVYTFKLVATGTKNPASTGTAIVNQYLRITNDDFVIPPEPPPDSLNPVYLDGLTIKASSYEIDPSHPPINAYDADLSTRWSALGVGSWLELRYDEVQTFSGVDIAHYQTNHNYFFDIVIDGDTVLKDQSSSFVEGFINYSFDPVQGNKITYVGNGNTVGNNWNSVMEFRPIITDIEPPPIEPPVEDCPYLYEIIRQGRFQVFVDGVQDEGEHNEYEKAIEHALQVKALNPTKNVIIKSPIRRVEIK